MYIYIIINGIKWEKMGEKKRFRGKFDAKLDDRGRIKIPSKFLSILNSNYGRGIYLTSLNGDYVWLYPLNEWELIEQKLESIKMNPVVQEYISRTSYWGYETEIDVRGRVLVPPELRNKGKLEDNIFVLGVRDHLEIWNESLYRNQYLKGEWTEGKQDEISRILNGISSLSSDE